MMIRTLLENIDEYLFACESVRAPTPHIYHISKEEKEALEELLKNEKNWKDCEPSEILRSVPNAIAVIRGVVLVEDAPNKECA